jgi:hypothetical protein
VKKSKTSGASLAQLIAEGAPIPLNWDTAPVEWGLNTTEPQIDGVA